MSEEQRVEVLKTLNEMFHRVKAGEHNPRLDFLQVSKCIFILSTIEELSKVKECQN